VEQPFTGGGFARIDTNRPDLYEDLARPRDRARHVNNIQDVHVAVLVESHGQWHWQLPSPDDRWAKLAGEQIPPACQADTSYVKAKGVRILRAQGGHPVLLNRHFSQLVARITIWEIGSNSVGNGSHPDAVDPGHTSYVGSPPRPRPRDHHRVLRRPGLLVHGHPSHVPDAMGGIIGILMRHPHAPRWACPLNRSGDGWHPNHCAEFVSRIRNREWLTRHVEA